jgi:sulfur carrier protein ThiS
MKIILKLYASLSDYLPPGSRDNRMALEADSDATVTALIERCQLPERLVHLVLVNGVYVAPGDRPGHALKEGDHLAIWPPIAGG